ncbi:MAG: hypothetical protein AB1489_30125 [Acidobacteriota bacterium]
MRKAILLLVALFVLVNITVIGSAKKIKQPLPTDVKLAEVKMIEIKDATGQALLTGHFTVASEGVNEIERIAELTTTGIDTDAAGKAEIELEKTDDSITNQGIAVSLNKLAASTNFKLIIDSNELTSFTTDKKGEAELELSSKVIKKH